MNRKPPPFRSATAFPNRTLAHLHNQIQQQKLVLQRVHKILPTAIAKHVQHCVINGKKLLVYTDSASWATQLRFYNSAILTSIAPVTKGTVSIMQIKIRSEVLRATVKTRKPNIPSAEQIQHIHKQSLVIEDGQLKLALLRLSAAMEKRLKLEG
jgi:hypothetical protein